METPLDPAAQLLEQERAAALPWLEYPRTPWFPLAGGLWAAAMLAAFLYLWRDPWMIPVLAVLVALEAGFFSWYRRRRGTSPSLRSAPSEFRPAFTGYVAGSTTVPGITGVLLPNFGRWTLRIRGPQDVEGLVCP